MAYIDPGSGALLWQVVVSAVLSAGYLGRRTVGNALRWLRQMFTRRDPSR